VANYTAILNTLSQHYDALNNHQDWATLAPSYIDISDFMTASMHVDAVAGDFSEDAVDLTVYRNMEIMCGDAGASTKFAPRKAGRS